MQKCQLGQSSVSVSPIIFGAWAIGGVMWGGSNDAEAIAAIQASLAAGVTSIDTAPLYGFGKSEELVARAVAGFPREKLMLATKCGLLWNSSEGVEPWFIEDPEGHKILIRKNSHPASIKAECEQSLKRLKVDYIDLYQIHYPDPSLSIAEAWNGMVQLKQAGKVRAIGVSNFSLQQLQEAHALHPVDSIQPPYSLIRRGIEKEIVPFCIQNKISILAYSPLERGLLTGKVSVERQLPKGDHRANKPAFSHENRQRVLETLLKLAPLAARHQATLAQLVAACTLQQPGITSILVGARTAAQAMENSQTTQISLTEEEKNLIRTTLDPLQALI